MNEVLFYIGFALLIICLMSALLRLALAIYYKELKAKKETSFLLIFTLFPIIILKNHTEYFNRFFLDKDFSDNRKEELIRKCVNILSILTIVSGCSLLTIIWFI